MSYLPNLDQLPAEILESTRAVVWNYETRDGKLTKVPYIAHWPTRKAAVDDPTTWGRFDEAFSTVESGKAHGCGIVLGDGLIGIDLDHVRDPATGVITPAALTIIRALDSYTEISVSGTGVHVLVHGQLPTSGRRRNGLEIYDSARYFTVTGQRLENTPATIEYRTPELTALHSEVFGAPPASLPPSSSLPAQTTLDDAALLVMARNASNGELFSRMWNGDTSGYDGDESAADLELPATLSQRAMQALDELRKDFEWLDASSTAIVRKKDAIRWWTFGGLYANAAIASRLKAERGYTVAPNNLAIKIAGEPSDSAIVNAIHAVRALDAETLVPEVTTKALEGLKFSACLPPELASRVLQRRMDDSDAVRRVLAERAQFVAIP